MDGKKIFLILSALALLLYSSRVCPAQYGRYTTRVAPAASACATGNCPTASIVPSKETEAKKDVAKEQKEAKAESEAPKDEKPAGDAVKEKESAAPPTISGLMEDVGVITLVYPSDAQSQDETVAYATRRAREPVDEGEDPLDTETPIGSIRNVGARLRELTVAVEEQRKQIDLIASKGGNDELFASLRTWRERDETFQKDARDGLASLLEVVKQQNERLIAQSAQRVVQKAVTPEPSTYWKWGLIALVCLTIFIVWVILIVKFVSWSVTFCRNFAAKAAENALAGLHTVKNGSNAPDELRL